MRGKDTVDKMEQLGASYNQQLFQLSDTNSAIATNTTFNSQMHITQHAGRGSTVNRNSYRDDRQYNKAVGANLLKKNMDQDQIL